MANMFCQLDLKIFCQPESGNVKVTIQDIELIGRERILKFNHDGIQARSLVDLETPIKAGDNINLKMRL
jgi:multiple sugar transport system ATP-binding protein